jgi:hypothetical protein
MRAYGVLTMHRNGFHGMRMVETPRRGVSTALQRIDALGSAQQRRQCTAMVSIECAW